MCAFIGPKNLATYYRITQSTLVYVTSGREYVALRRNLDPKRPTVSKLRRSFMYGHQYFELDYFLSPVKYVYAM